MAVDIFLKIKGVKGESQDSVHAGAIDIQQWSWGMTQSGTTHTATGGGSGKVNVQDITLTKYVDMSTHELMKHCAEGKHFAEAELIVRKAGENPLEYFKIKMEDLIVTSYSTGGSGDGLDRIIETVTLNFARYVATYASQKVDGSKGPEGKAGYDMARNKPHA